MADAGQEPSSGQGENRPIDGQHDATTDRSASIETLVEEGAAAPTVSVDTVDVSDVSMNGSSESSNDSEMETDDDDPIRAAIIATALAGAAAPLRWISNEILQVPITIVRDGYGLQNLVKLLHE